MTNPGRMAAVMDELVAGARSTRDGAFNTLDAINRQTRAANTALQAQVDRVCEQNPPPRPVVAEADPDERATTPAERDSRFDPEDEWEVPGPATPGTSRRPAASDAAGHRDVGAADADDADDDYGQTWLR